MNLRKAKSNYSKAKRKLGLKGKTNPGDLIIKQSLNPKTKKGLGRLGLI